METLKPLRPKDDIICKPDKGNAVVLLNRTDYVNKMNMILSDKSKFVNICTNQYNLIINLENKINRFVHELKKSTNISHDILGDLHPIGSQPGILYGVPKIHKTNAPLRPILSCVNCHNTKLSSFAVKLLQPLINSKYICRDSHHFLHNLFDTAYSMNYTIVSFDIESLFTNIPVSETIKIATDMAFPDGQDLYKGLRKEQFIKLLELCAKDTVFVFNDQLYKQIDGMATGNPLGPIFADIFLDHYEKKSNPNFTNVMLMTHF